MFCLPSPVTSNRRTLGSSESSQSFLETFGGLPTAVTHNCVTQTYVCKPCLGRLENGQKIVESANVRSGRD